MINAPNRAEHFSGYTIVTVKLLRKDMEIK